MARNDDRRRKERSPRAEDVKNEVPAARRKESPRDFIESIVVAFILAFLVRGFEAEAFVIPTGSMAPTLMGMHKEVECPHCGYTFTVNASEDYDPRFLPRNARIPQQIAALCGNCRGPVKLADEDRFNGDRILVNKFLYDLPFLAKPGPDRWEVVVFHYPEEPETNYIKRLVGMPDEELRIFLGDIYTRPRNSTDPFRIVRKPLGHQQAMQMMVWDDRYRPAVLTGRPDWARWAPRAEGQWAEPEPGRFEARADADWAELRYRHLVPDPAQWNALIDGDPLPYPPQRSLISDFYAYNSGSTSLRSLGNAIPPHWVGDLTLSARLESKSDSGSIRLELIEAGEPNRCEIDLATGMATLSRGGRTLGEPAQTPFKGVGTHDVIFANVDGRLTLWVDGATPFGEGVPFEDGSEYSEGQHPIPTEADLDPVGIATKGAEVVASDLVLKRDIYYTLDPGGWDYSGLGLSQTTTLSDPSEFSVLRGVQPADFEILPGRYMMLGDNSPRSKDGRGWSRKDEAWDPSGRQSWEVPESLLIGKAFFVYWPHGVPLWPEIPIRFRGMEFKVPFRPYLERMKFIR